MVLRTQHERRRRADDKSSTPKPSFTLSATSRVAARWKDLTLFAAVTVAACALRLIYIQQLRSSPEFADPQVDELYHDQWAQAIAAGETFIEGPYFRAPLYPAFLAAVYKLFGHNYLAPRVVQGILGSLSCGLLFLIGRYTFGRATGVVAGFAAASCWILIYFDGELLIPVLIIFLDLVLIGLLLWAARSPRPILYAFAGVVLGLSAIARPTILVFGLGVVVWLAVMYRREHRRALVHVVCLTTGCLLVVLPITIRNYVVGKDLVLIASQGGLNFYIGNNPESNGWSATIPGAPPGWEGIRVATERAEEARGRPLKPSEVSRYYFAQSWKFIRQRPGKFLSLMGLKLSLFWSRWEISNNKGIYFWTERFTPIVRLLPLNFGVVGPLSLLGLVLCWRRGLGLFPLWGFVALYVLSVLLFFCTARYRAPVLPVLVLLATSTVFQGVSAVRGGRWKGVVAALAVLALAVPFVHLTPTAETFQNPAPQYVRLGDAYDQQGEHALAESSYRQALELTPWDVSAQLKLGRALYKAKRLPEAIAEWRRALTNPLLDDDEEVESVAWVHFYLGNALAACSDYDEAIAHYRACMALDPSGMQGRALSNLGALLLTLGRAGEARVAFQQALTPLGQALRDNSGDPELLYLLGRSLFSLDRFEDSLAPLREWARLQPENLQAVDCLTDALLRAGRYQEAIRRLRDALRLRNPNLVNRLALLLAACPDDSLRSGPEALQYARDLCPQVQTCSPIYADTLAAALAETGRFDEAAHVLRRVLDRLQQSPQPTDPARIRLLTSRLNLYELHQPYRLP